MALWYYLRNGEQQGPVDDDTLRRMIRSGEVGSSDYVWRDGMSDWARAGDQPELSGGTGGFAGGAAPPAPPPPGRDSQYPPSRVRHEQPHRGTTVLVLGILSLVVCGILGIFAWVMGKGDLRKMEQGVMDRSGESTTRAGMILGMIATILMIVAIVIYAIVLCAGAGAMSRQM